MELEGLPPRTVKWEPDEFQQYLQTCYRFSQPAMALLGMLCFFLCQRPGDMTKLKWTDLNAEFVNFVQSKTKKSMSLWMGTDLRHTLDKTPKQAEYIVIRGDGRPFSQRDYGREFEYLRYKAGIRDELQLRDLRRTGLTLLADGGATENQLKTVHGTSDSRVLSIYTLRTPKQSQDALVRLQHAGFSL
jgi:integrase